MELPIVLKSRRLWVGLIGLIFMVLVQIIPTLAEHAETLSNAAIILIGLLIGGYTVEDALLAKNDAATVNAQKFGRK